MRAIAQRTPHQQLWLLLFAATLLRLLFAQTGYGMDESYTVATARDYHLSGYDHPPMAWWLATMMQHLFHTVTPWVVRLPFVLLSAVATWQIFRLTELLFTARAGMFAALVFSCAPALGITDGTWVLPDGPLLVGLLAGAICLVHLFFDARAKGWWWLLAGFWGGIAMLSKYHGVFFFFGAFLFVVTHRRHWHWLRSPWPYLGGVIGLAIFSPVVIWNIEHDFASFAFQSGRTGETHFNPLKPLQMLLGQAVFLAPWIWLGLVAATRQAMRVCDEKRALLMCLGLPLVTLFTLVAAISSGTMLYHWAMPGYLFLVPLLGDWLEQCYATRPRFVKRWAIAAASIVTVLLGIVALLWFAPAQVQQLGIPKDPLGEMRPLTEIHAYLDDHPQLDARNLVVAPVKWHSAGQFGVALNGRVPVTCFCADARQFGVLAPLAGMTGKNFLIPVPMKHSGEAKARYGQFFSRFTRLDDLVIHQGGSTTYTYAMFYGTRLKADASPQ